MGLPSAACLRQISCCWVVSLLTYVMIPADPLSKVAEVAEKAQTAVKDIFTDDNVLEYCSLDERVGIMAALYTKRPFLAASSVTPYE